VSERNGARRHPLEFLSAAAILAACAGCPQYRDASVPNEIARAVAPDGDAAYLLYVPSTYDREHTWPLVILSIPMAVSIHTVTAFLYNGFAARPFWNASILAPRFLASAF